MSDSTKQKIIKIIVSTAYGLAFLGALWGIGRIIIHDIPTMITGYDYVVVETKQEDDFMGIYHEVVTEEAKRPVSFESALSDLLSNFITLTISVGLIIAYPSFDKENKYRN